MRTGACATSGPRRRRRVPPFDPFRLLYRSVVGRIGRVRREAFEQVGGFDQEQAGFEDWDLMLAFLEHDWGVVWIESGLALG